MLACVVGRLDDVSAGVGTDPFDKKSLANVRSNPLGGRSLEHGKRRIPVALPGRMSDLIDTGRSDG